MTLFVGAIVMLLNGKALAITDKIEINCNPGAEAPNNCDVSPSSTAPLFDEDDYPMFDLKPGDEIHREIIVYNNRDETCYFTLTDATNTHDTETPPGSGNWFSDRLETEITDGVDTTNLIPFSALFSLTDIYLTELAPFTSKTLDWDVFFDENAGNEYQNARLVFDFTWNFSCGEEPPETVLFIEKTNNKLPPTVQEPGANVTYTMFVTTEEFPVFNVIVLDLPPGGFTYLPGSWTASSNFRGDLKGGGTTPEPTYASPGLWTLGDMQAGEIVTLTYVTDIDPDQQPGEYKDIAWTEGTASSDPLSTRVMGNESTGFFVGTSAIVDIGEIPEVEVKTEEEIIEITEGEVLGISLPATGADNVWMFIIANLFGAGLIFILIGFYLKRSRRDNGQKVLMQIFALLVAGVVFSSPAYAAGLLIRIEEPKSPNNLETLDLNFVVMDIENQPVDVKCFKQGPGEIAFTQFGSTQTTIPGGDTGYCPISTSILSGEGTYKFYAEAETFLPADNSTSQTVTIEHDSQKPGKPHNLEKDKNGSCKYDISFTTDNDGGDTVRVEVYRSDDKEFYVNSSTKIKDINVGSDTDVNFINDKPSCGKTYYYAVRAFDAAGNGSKILVEELQKEKITIITEGETVVEESVFGEVIGAIEIEEGTTEVGEEETEEAKEEAAEIEEVLGIEEEAGVIESLISRLLRIFKWPVIIVLILIVFFYVKEKRGKKQNPQQPQQH